MDPALALTLRLALSALFLAAAYHKTRDIARFRAILSAYRVMPERIVVPIARVLIACELIVGSAFLIGEFQAGFQQFAASGAVALLVAYTAGIAVNLLRGRREIDCGCGDLTRNQPIGPLLLFRNAVLIVAAAVLLTTTTARTLTWLDGATVFGAFSCIALLWSAASILTTVTARTTRQRVHS